MEVKPTSDQLSAPVPQHSEVQQPGATGAGNFGKFLGNAVNIAGNLAAKAAGAQTMGIGPLVGSIAGGLNGGVGGAGGLGGGLDGAIGDQGAQFQQLLELPEQIPTQSAEFNSLTNISKTEHETRMSAIRNIRAG
jgi:hypothetical protein